MKKQTFKQAGSNGFFGLEFRIQQINGSNNILNKLKKTIDFELFRSLLEENLINKEKKSNVGAKPYDFVLMFKILILQQIYGLSDEQMEFQIMDRLSFQQFLGLTIDDKVPDARSIWAFREKVVKTNLDEKLFSQFLQFLDDKGMILNEGKIVDASIVSVPKQRNSKAINDEIKEGNGDQFWNDNPNKKRQKDIDARWLNKNGENFYGYKDHAKVDDKSKLIDKYHVSAASLHDSQPVEYVLDENDFGQPFYGDSAYTGPAVQAIIAKFGMINRTHEKGHRNNPLTEEQKVNNTEKSSIRARVEHVFGFVTNSMSDFFSRLIGFDRSRTVIGLINLCYNLCRYEQIVRLDLLKDKIRK